jgi:hypothetical protein
MNEARLVGQTVTKAGCVTFWAESFALADMMRTFFHRLLADGVPNMNDYMRRRNIAREVPRRGVVMVRRDIVSSVFRLAIMSICHKILLPIGMQTHAEKLEAYAVLISVRYNVLRNEYSSQGPRS